MFHHSAEDYKTAASAAAKRGRDKMQAIIDRGRDNAQKIIGDIQARTISDTVVRAPALKLVYDDDGDRWIDAGDKRQAIHDHAFGQLLANSRVGKTLYNDLVDEAGGQLWGKNLLANTVNTVMSHRTQQRNLIRSENGTAMGFLSDKFRRLDSRPVVDAFMAACVQMGMVPIDGVASDTKMRVRAVLPYVFEPIDTEVMLFGAELGNSDYGDGGLVVNLWTMRVWCTNLAIAEKCLRQVHIGSKLPDNVLFSAETYHKDAETTALAVRDVTADAVSPDRIHRMLAAVEDAGDEAVKGRDGLEKVLARAGLSKNEVNQIGNVFESPDVENLPAGDTLWRLSNAVSFFAQSKSVSPDRKIDLQNLAGELVTPKKSKGTGVRELKF